MLHLPTRKNNCFMGISILERNKSDMMMQRLIHKLVAICYKFKYVFMETALILQTENKI